MKKKVLYISNTEVPYRTKYFNLLSKETILTVLYERKTTSNRNDTWAKSEKPLYKIEYLKGIKYKNEFSYKIKICCFFL